MTRNGHGGAGGTSPDTAAEHQPRADQPGCRKDRTTRRIVATARAYAPAGRRTTHLLVVTRCPFHCGGVHAHRGAEHGGPRKAGCGRGEYILRGVPAVRAVAA